MTRTQICTFDLWPPRCWLQAAAASPNKKIIKKTLYACWQPGSKGCKNVSGLFYIYSQWRRQPTVTVTVHHHKKKKITHTNTNTHTIQLRLIIYVKIKKTVFYFSEDKIISNYFSGSDHIGLCCERDIAACRTFSK